ncbi:MAG: hypothetical protein ABL956_01380 [Hyphomonadaceae bacterium]
MAGLIWPQRSLIANREVAGPGALEPGLWAKLQFPSDPVCARCATAFEIAVDPALVSAACVADPPLYRQARAALVCGDVLRHLVLGLKYQSGLTGFRC